MPHNIKEIPFQPSSIETIDMSMFNWLVDKNIHATTNRGWKKVDILWIQGERTAQIKEKYELRDDEGTLILPRITLERTTFTKDMGKKGAVQAHHPVENDYKGGVFVGAKIINQLKSSEFNNAQSFRKTQERVGKGQINFKSKKNKPQVYKTITMPLPTYVNVNYEITLRAEYDQQMNEILQPFLTESGNITSFFVYHDGHKFECFYDSNFNQENNKKNLAEEERKMESTISVRVLGYLMGEGTNDKYPKQTIRENAVEFKFSRERAILEDDNQFTSETLYRQ